MTMRRREIVLALAALGFTSTHAAALDPMAGNVTEQGNTDHGNTDHGNTDHGNTDH